MKEVQTDEKELKGSPPKGGHDTETENYFSLSASI